MIMISGSARSSDNKFEIHLNDSGELTPFFSRSTVLPFIYDYIFIILSNYIRVLVFF